MPGCRAVAASQPKKPYPTESVRSQKLGNPHYRRKKQLKNEMTFRLQFFRLIAADAYAPCALSGTVHGINKGKRFSCFTLRDDAPFVRKEQRFRLLT